MDTMTYTTQSLWTWWIAMYLFFGGLGAATLSISFLTDMYCRPHRKLVLWGALSGVVMLALSSAVLFGHLLHHTAVITCSTRWCCFTSPMPGSPGAPSSSCG